MFERIIKRAAVEGGYTQAACHRVVLEGGQLAFVKRAADDFTARCLERELDLYEQLAGAPF